MPISQSGVQLVVEDYAAFVQQLGGANEAVQQFNQQLQASSQQAAQAGQQLGQVGTTMQQGAAGFDAITQASKLTDEQLATVTARATELMNTSKGGMSANEAYAQAMQELGTASGSAAAGAADLAKEQDALAKKTEITGTRMKQLGREMLVAGGAIEAMAIGAAMTASRIEELEVLLEVTRVNAMGAAEAEAEFAEANLNIIGSQKALAKASTLTSEAVQKQVDGIRALHLTGIVANQTVANLIRYNLDWTKATDLARIAQDAATFAAQDSSQAIQGLINGITTLQPRVLRTYGIMVNLEIAYEKFAMANNIAVESMTVTQRQQAALNEVLAQAPSIAGAYEAAMGTASKQIRSLKTDTINLAEAFGESMTPALDMGVGGLRSFIQWLTELDSPLRAAVAGTGSAASAMLLLGGAALTTLPRLVAIIKTLKDLQAASTASAASLLGPVGLIAGLTAIVGIGVVSYLQAQEKAHRDEAAAILDSSVSYRDYIKDLEDAGLEAYGFSEALYALIKAKQETDAAFASREMQDAMAEWLALGRLAMGQWEEGIPVFVNGLSDAALAMGTDRDMMMKLGQQMGYSGKHLEDFVTRIILASTEEIRLRKITNQLQDEYAGLQKVNDDFAKGLDATIVGLGQFALGSQRATQSMQDSRRAAAFITGAFSDFASQLENYVTPEVERLRVELNTLFQTPGQGAAAMLDKVVKDWVAISKKAEDDILELRKQAGEDTEEAWSDHAQDMLDLEGDYAKNRTGILQDFDRDRREMEEEFAQDMVDLDAELAADRAEAYDELLRDLDEIDRDYAQDREDAARDLASDLADIERKYAQDIADMERELAQDIEDARRDLYADLAELDREYAQDRESAARELADDLAEIDRRHQQQAAVAQSSLNDDLEDMEEDHQQRMTELAKAYAQNRASIMQDYLETVKDINERYTVGPTAEEQREQRREDLLREAESLKRQRELRGGPVSEREKEVLAELEKMKQAELAQAAAIADAKMKQAKREYDQARGEEERQYRERKKERERQYEEERAEQEQRYQEERTARQKEYDDELAQMQGEYERQKAERLREYDDKLADLRLAFDREAEERRLDFERQKEDRQRDYQEQLDEMAREHERQRAERQRAYEQTLIDLDTQHAAEEQKARDSYARQQTDLQEALAEKLADEAQSYTDRKAQLDDALAQELLDIQTNLEKESTATQEGATEMMQNYVDAVTLISPLLGAELQKMMDEEVVPKTQDMVDGSMEEFSKLGPEMAQSVIDSIPLVAGALDQMLLMVRAKVDAMVAEFERAKILGKSPAPLFVEMGESWVEGLQKGLGGLESSVGSLFDTSQWQLPSFPSMQMASMPPGASNNSTTNTSNLNVTAQYANYQSQSSLMQDLQGWKMMMRYGGR